MAASGYANHLARASKERFEPVTFSTGFLYGYAMGRNYGAERED